MKVMDPSAIIKMIANKWTKVLALTLILQLTQATDFHVSCQTDQDCATLINRFYTCQANYCSNDTMLNFESSTIIGLVLIVLISAIANAGGIGGGAILSALYILWFNFSLGDAIPLSNATIFSGALMNFFVIFNKRQDKNQNRLMIDYQLASLILPLMLGGAMVGVIANKVLPPVFIVGFLTYYLVTRTISFYKDAKEVTEKESQEKEHERKNKMAPLARNSRKLVEKKLVELAHYTPRNSVDLAEIKDRRLNLSTPDELLLAKQETSRLGLFTLLAPFKRYIYLCGVTYLVISVTMLFRGGKAFPSIIGIGSCSVMSWLIFIASQGVLVGLAWYSLRSQERESIDQGMPVVGSFSLDYSQGQEHMKHFMLDSFKAGVISGTLGLGGGMILMPMLVSKNFLPAIASAVCGVLVLITSFSTTTQFLIMGAFNIRSTLVVIICSAVGSYFGSQLISYAVTKYQKPSLIMWVVFAVLLLSAVILPYVGLLNLIQNPKFLSFSSPC
jgi:uncharacterized membrane protein YfcA